MTRRTSFAVLATAALALLLAAAAPQAGAVSFVDKQVQAGGLLIQNYINTYGQAHQFVYPPKSMVKKGGKLPNSTLIWPANPWTGKVMGHGTARGTYTYSLGKDGRSYKLIMHLSKKPDLVLKGGMPAWFKTERNTASKHNLLLLQWYLSTHYSSGTYPETLSETSLPSPPHVWPKNPWTGAAMAAGEGLGEFSYTRTSSGSGFALKVKLTSGWSSPALGPVL